MYKLNYEKAVVLQISNDAFFYLAKDEYPIDEANFEEIEEIQEMFPCGFYIEDNWSYVEDCDDLIEATFVPYEEDKWDYDEYIDMFNDWQLQIKWLDGKSKVRIRYYNPVKEPMHEQICVVQGANTTRPYIRTELGSIFHLWKMSKVM